METCTDRSVSSNNKYGRNGVGGNAMLTVNLKTGPSRPEHEKIPLVITVVDFWSIFSLQYQSINQSTKWRMQALKCLCIRILNVHATFNSNQYQLSTLIDLWFRQFQLCNQTWNLDMTSIYRIMDFSLPRPFAPRSESSRCGTFAPWNFRSLVLSKRMEDGAKIRNREQKFQLWNFCSH